MTTLTKPHDTTMNNPVPTDLIELLNRLVADETVLQTKTKGYHWNVEGLHFRGLHNLFEEQYDQLAEMTDEIAERARQLGGYAITSLKEALSLTQLTETAAGHLAEKTMLTNLLADHETVIASLHKAIEVAAHHNNVAAEDDMTGWLKAHQKMAWMLRAHLA